MNDSSRLALAVSATVAAIGFAAALGAGVFDRPPSVAPTERRIDPPVFDAPPSVATTERRIEPPSASLPAEDQAALAAMAKALRVRIPPSGLVDPASLDRLRTLNEGLFGERGLEALDTLVQAGQLARGARDQFSSLTTEQLTSLYWKARVLATILEEQVFRVQSDVAMAIERGEFQRARELVTSLPDAAELQAEVERIRRVGGAPNFNYLVDAFRFYRQELENWEIEGQQAK